jgi:Ca2+/Na+ antiporter
VTGLPTVAAVAGAAVSLAVSWLLVSRLERVGGRLVLSEAPLGLVAALAADAPEVTAAITAIAGDQQRIGAGVVIGSNAFNLAALLSLGAVPGAAAWSLSSTGCASLSPSHRSTYARTGSSSAQARHHLAEHDHRSGRARRPETKAS